LKWQLKNESAVKVIGQLEELLGELAEQEQRRFKRTGQLRSPAGHEALLGLDSLWRNERWPPAVPAHPPRQPVQKLKCAVIDHCGIEKFA
jgi:hypothetical protein